jgi:ubiquitin-protein ligase
MPKVYKSKLAPVSNQSTPYPVSQLAKASTLAMQEIDWDKFRVHLFEDSSPVAGVSNSGFSSTEVYKFGTEKIAEDSQELNDQSEPSTSAFTSTHINGLSSVAVAGSSNSARPYDPEFGYIIPIKQPFLKKFEIDDVKTTQTSHEKSTPNPRILHDIKEFWDSPPEGIIATPTEDDIFLWTVNMAGPEGSPFEGGEFNGILQIPSNYPFTRPTFTFTSSIFHPNISEEGVVCIGSLLNRWSPCFTLTTFVNAIRYLLGDPSTREPVNYLAASVFENEHSAYIEIAKQCVDMQYESAVRKPDDY